MRASHCIEYEQATTRDPTLSSLDRWRRWWIVSAAERQSIRPSVGSLLPSPTCYPAPSVTEEPRRVLRNPPWNVTPTHPPPRNANNVEPYTFVTLFSGNFTHLNPPPIALRNTWMAPHGRGGDRWVKHQFSSIIVFYATPCAIIKCSYGA